MTYGVKMVIEGVKEATVVLKGATKEDAQARADQSNAIAKENGASEYIKAVVFMELNQHEKVLNKLIKGMISEYIGGYENTLLDYPEGSEEYEEAKKVLTHDNLFPLFYHDIMVESKANYMSHVRFAGKKFIEDMIEHHLAKEGYGK